MPGHRFARVTETGTKAVELALRTVGEAPEQRAARRLAATAGTPSPGARRVLFVTPRDWAAHVQYEGVIAQALRLRGADVRFLTCGGGLEICDRANTYEAPPMPCTTCDRYVRTSIEAHGFPRTSMRSLWEVEDEDPGDWPELDAMGAADLEHVMVGDLDLGSLVDKPVRWFLLEANVEEDPLGPRVRRRFLRSARRIVRAVERALDEQRPDVVMVLNGLFLFESITWALCQARGIDVVTYERAFRKETLVFQPARAPAGFYDFSEAWAESFRDLTEEEGAEIDDYLALRRSGRAFDQHWGPGTTPASRRARGASSRCSPTSRGTRPSSGATAPSPTSRRGSTPPSRRSASGLSTSS